MTEKQYPLGSYTQNIYNFASDEVFTGHVTVDRLPPPPHPSPPLPTPPLRRLFSSIQVQVEFFI